MTDEYIVRRVAEATEQGWQEMSVVGKSSITTLRTKKSVYLQKEI